MHARPLDTFASTLIFGLCIIWGFNQVGVLIQSLKDYPPRNKSVDFNLDEAMRALNPATTER